MSDPTFSPKSTLNDLAVFGGRPAFGDLLHVGRPCIGDRDRLIARINDILDRACLTNNGPLVQEFERRLCALAGVKHCVAVCNATVGLEILIRALELSGEVIVPSWTFIATAHALRWLGITPVFCDVDAATHNIDPAQVERLITPRTTGIIGVHLWGRPCDVAALTEIARRRGLRLIFDAAHALACSHHGTMIGNFGDAEVYSFHATKFVNTFEGGAIVTNDDALADRLRLMRNFGFAGFDNVVGLGTNGKMTEVAAAMGLTGLESLDDFVSVNRRNHERYRRSLEGIAGIRMLAFDAGERCNYQYAVLEIDEPAAGIGRDEVLAVLQVENVRARRYFFPGCHRMEPYRSTDPDAGQRLPETEKVSGRVLVLPTGSAVGAAEIDVICQIIRLVVENAVSVRARLSS